MTEFISRWYVPYDGSSIVLPIVSPCTVSVDWGDNSLMGFNATTDVSHAYSGAAADHTITISGGAIILDFSGTGVAHLAAMRTQLLDISQCGTGPNVLQLGNSGGIFKNCVSLNWTATDAPLLTGVTTLESVFEGVGQKGYTSSTADFSGWNLNTVTILKNAFKDSCMNPSGLNSWDVSGCTSMNGMFQGAKNFNQSLNMWDTSACRDFTDMLVDTAMFTNNRRPEFRNVADPNSWILNSDSYLSQVITNSDVSAKSMYRANPYAGRFVLQKATEAKVGRPSGASVAVATSSVAAVRQNTSNAR